MFGRFATRWSWSNINIKDRSCVKITGIAAGLTSAILIHQYYTPTAYSSTTITSSSSSASSSSVSLEDRIRILYGDRSPPVAKTEVQSLASSATLSDAIGSTPSIALKSLEQATGCIIWAKAEHLNPGFSIKDRAAKYMLDEAERTGQLKRGQGVVIEATGGNTGIGVSLLCAARNYRCILCMPQSISQDKINMMRAFGAEVRLAPAVPFGHHDHYYSVATRLAKEIPNSIFTNQFENIANARGHYETTGPEIWTQTRGHVDGVCVSAGTGGTIAGLSLYFKQQNPRCVTALIDCAGSALYSYLTQGELKPTSGTTIAEGIGITRLTANFRLALIDRAYAGYDQEAIDMAYYLLKHEGLWVGPSAALNVVGAVKLARELGPGHQIVTVLCDSGDKYRSTLYDPSYLASRDLLVREQDSSLKWIS